MYFLGRNLDVKKNEVLLMYFSCNFDKKLMQILSADFDLCLEDKKLLSFQDLFLKSFWYIKNKSRLSFAFGRYFIWM